MTGATDPHPHLTSLEEVLRLGPRIVHEHAGPNGPLLRLADLAQMNWQTIGLRTQHVPHTRAATRRMLRIRIGTTYGALTSIDLAEAAVARFTTPGEARTAAATQWETRFERYLEHAVNILWRQARSWRDKRQRPVDAAVIERFTTSLLAHAAAEARTSDAQLRLARRLVDNRGVDLAPIGLPLWHATYDLQDAAVRAAITRAVIDSPATRCT